MASLRVTSISTMKTLAEYIFSLSIAIDGNANGIVKIPVEPTFLTLPPDGEESYYEPFKKASSKWIPVTDKKLGHTVMKLSRDATISDCEGFCASELWLFCSFDDSI